MSDDTRLTRQRLTAAYKGLHDDLLAILFHHDPMGLNFEDNTDEYAAEVSTIIARLRDARSAEDVRRIAHEEFVQWFEADSAGPESTYAGLAQDIWDAWQRYRANDV